MLWYSGERFVSLLFVNIYCKTNFMAKNVSDLCNFYSKLDFRKTLIKNIFAFLYGFKLLMILKNIVKILEILNKWNLVKICLKFTYATNFCFFLQPFKLREK